MTQRRVSATSGEVRGGGGFVRLNIPAGALDRAVEFAITELPNVTEAMITADGRDIAFRAPVRLTMSYARCPANVPAPGKQLAIWRYRGQGPWRNLGGQINDDRSLSVDIDSISRFVIATN